MKRLTTLLLALCMLFALTACGNIGGQNDEDVVITLGDTGATVVIPSNMGFEAQESEQNDFYGLGSNQEWAIIANVHLKSDYADYTFAEYVSATAEANKGSTPGKDLNGNYSFTYINDLGDKCYSTVIENESEYIHVTFYCSEDAWDTYRPQFKEWAETIAVKSDNTDTTNSDTNDDGDVSQEDANNEGIAVPLGDTGATVVIPADTGFEAQESELNDFYGLGANQEWAIIANVEPKSDYPDSTIADYTSASAQANEATVGQDSDGNYYFTYVKDMGDGDIYTYYTAVRENETNYIRVAFYCFNDAWDTYGSQFSDWSTTIEFK